jgi:hypothetical protein
MKRLWGASIAVLGVLAAGCVESSPFKPPGSGPSDAAVPVGSDASAVTPGVDDAGDNGDAGHNADAGPGCVGIPIIPDDTGFVAPGSNDAGIHGSWFVYSDCNDLGGHNCAMVASPTGVAFANTGGALCTSGTTSSAPGAWGAGIGLELNDGPPQLPFDTMAAGIKGFCFQLTGPTLPTTTVRVAFPTVDNNDNAYFESVSSPGQHTVLFTDTAQGSWVTAPQPFESTAVTLIQFQIPSSTSATIPWDFCVEGLTAVTQ